MDRFRHRLRLKALERRGHRQREREHRQRQMPQTHRAATTDHDGSLAVDDTMPPAGSHPVRAARKTSTSDVTSGGSETHKSESAAHEHGQRSRSPRR